MKGREFAQLVETGLLLQVEEVVVEAVRSLDRKDGAAWTRPQAYRWLRYEDPDPVARLAQGVEKLRRRDAEFDAEAVDKACVEASKAGFLN